MRKDMQKNQITTKKELPVPVNLTQKNPLENNTPIPNNTVL